MQELYDSSAVAAEGEPHGTYSAASPPTPRARRQLAGRSPAPTPTLLRRPPPFHLRAAFSLNAVVFGAGGTATAAPPTMTCQNCARVVSPARAPRRRPAPSHRPLLTPSAHTIDFSQINASRFAPHLDKCMQSGGRRAGRSQGHT